MLRTMMSMWWVCLTLMTMVGGVRGSPSPPSFVPMGKIAAVSTWLRDLAARGDSSFSIGALARAQNRYLASHSFPAQDHRPSSMHVRDMYSAHHLRSGEHPLPPGDNALRVDGFVTLHRHHCADCAAQATGIAPHCYFNTVVRCLSHGFDPPRMTLEHPTSLYAGKGVWGNHASCEAHMDYVDKQVSKLLDDQIIRPATAPILQAPLGVTIAPSRATMAYQLTGINPVDDRSYDEARSRLMTLVPGFEQLFKRRLISDNSAPGLNAQMEMRPFRYIDIGDLLAMVRPRCTMAIVDIVAYYHNYPLAMEARHLFGLRWRGLAYVWGRLPFGGSAHPYLASVMTAEICAGLRALGVPVVAMIDDFAMVGSTHEQCSERLRLMQQVVVSLGLQVSTDKTQLGQQVKFIGFLVDAVNMVVSFDRVSVAAFIEILRQAIWCLSVGRGWDHAFALHVAGKLNHYASVVQAGRLRLATLWAYVRTRGALSAMGHQRFVNDLVWWERLLSRWMVGEVGGGQFPIINTATLLDDAQCLGLLIGVTDFSGPDGVGGYFGRLHDQDPEVFTVGWYDGTGPASSLVGELYALWYLLRLLSERDQPPPCKLFIWVTDNLGAAFCVNAGSCDDEHDGRILLELIFDLAMELGWFLLALWHPRTLNTLADYYSHLSRIMGVDALTSTVSSVEQACRVCEEDAGDLPGVVGEVTTITSSIARISAQEGIRAEHVQDQGCSGGTAEVGKLRRMVREDRTEHPTNVRHDWRLLMCTRGEAAGVNSINRPGQVTAEVDGVADAQVVVVEAIGHEGANAGAPNEVRGHVGRSADVAIDDSYSQQGDPQVGSVRPRRASASGDRQDRSARLDEGGRGDGRAAGVSCSVATAAVPHAHTSSADQARAHWARAVRKRSAGRARQVLRDEAGRQGLEDVGPRPQTRGVRVSGYFSGTDRPDEVLLGGGVAGTVQAHRARGGV